MKKVVCIEETGLNIFTAMPRSVNGAEAPPGG